MWTPTYWKQLLENVIGAAAAAGAGYLGTTTVPDLPSFDWRALVSAMAVGGLLAFLLGLAKNPLGTAGTPSVVKVPPPPAPVAAVSATAPRRPLHDDAPDWD